MAFWNRKSKEILTPPVEGAVRTDGWFSSLSAFGTTKDKRMSIGINPRILNDQECQNLWTTDDIAARIVEVPAKESLRQGFSVKAGDKAVSEDVSALLEEFCATKNFVEAKKYERAYGGSAIYPVINDGNENLAEPLNEDRISKIDCIHVFQKRELTPNKWYSLLTDKKFRQPMTYNLNPLSSGGFSHPNTEIHESRLIIFPGIRVSWNQPVSNGWGYSVFNRVFEVLADYGISWASTAVLLHEFSQASFKIKGLAALLAADKDHIIKTRIRAVELARSTINAVLMDAEEEYERKQTPVSGLAELLDRFTTRLAAAADMPVTLLMGQSPSGLNATGESDIRFFYDRVKVIQDLEIKDQLERLVYLIFRSITGPTRGKEPDNWSVEFNPLWQPSAKEQADERHVIAQTDQIYVQLQVYEPEDVRKNRFEGDTFSSSMHIEEEDLEPDDDIKIDEGEPVDENGKSIAEETGTKLASGLMDIVSRMIKGEVSRESACVILKMSFHLTDEQAEEVLGPEDFAAPEPEAPGGFDPDGNTIPPDDELGDDDYDPDDEFTEDDFLPVKEEERADGGPGSGPRPGSGSKEKESSGKSTKKSSGKDGKDIKGKHEFHPDLKVSPFLGIKNQEDVDKKYEYLKKEGGLNAKGLEKLAKLHAKQSKKFGTKPEKASTKKETELKSKTVEPKTESELKAKIESIDTKMAANKASFEAKTEKPILHSKPPVPKQLSPEFKEWLQKEVDPNWPSWAKAEKAALANEGVFSKEPATAENVETMAVMSPEQQKAALEFDKKVQQGIKEFEEENAIKDPVSLLKDVIANPGAPTLDKNEALAHRDKAYNGPPPATTQQKTAVSNYTSNGYEDVNSYLRTGKDKYNKGEAKITKNIELIDSMMERSILDRDITVYRGFSGKPVAGLKEGDVFVDKAFVSTTSSGNVAARFATTGIEDQAFMKITVPKGANALIPVSNYAEEREVILPRGSKFKINAVTTQILPKGRTRRVFDVEVIRD